MKKVPPQTADSIRLRNLKRFVRTCGLHKNYVKLFSGCDTMTQREKTLERILREDTGFEGKKYNLSPRIQVMYYYMTHSTLYKMILKTGLCVAGQVDLLF